MDVFILSHTHRHPSGDEDDKLIGVYALRHDAEAAIQRLSLQPGFREYPEGFSIDVYSLGEDHWTEGYETVRA